MTRYKIIIEYDGTNYHGWQRQDGLPTIQASIEKALTKIFQKGIKIMGAGRTDTGVHALAQVAHFDLTETKNLSPFEIGKAINAHLLGHPIAISKCAIADDEFHARFDAKQKIYRYRILNRSAHPTLTRNFVWHVKQKLDADAMHKAAQDVIGKHDFTSFRDTDCQAKSPVRKLDRLDVTRNGDEIIIEAEAQSFLHHQVRNLVGSLVDIGKGKEAPDFMSAALAAKDRRAAGPTAPSSGLCLVSIEYSQDH